MPAARSASIQPLNAIHASHSHPAISNVPPIGVIAPNQRGAPIAIPPQQAARDRAFVSQVHLAQNTGRQIVTEQRDFRRANPTAAPRIPRPLPPAQVPQQQRPKR